MARDKPYNLLDEIIHQRTRLAIMATLAGVESLDFNDLRAQLGLTDGNLSSHLAALDRAGYARIAKTFRRKKPRTTISQTPKGTSALRKYVNHLQGILDKARPQDKANRKTGN